MGLDVWPIVLLFPHLHTSVIWICYVFPAKRIYQRAVESERYLKELYQETLFPHLAQTPRIQMSTV